MKIMVVLILLSSPCQAHGIAAWIQNHPDYGWCCSEKDCHKGDGRVRFTGDGWMVRGVEGELRRGQKGLYADAPITEPWYCEYPVGKLRCIFLPKVKI